MQAKRILGFLGVFVVLTIGQLANAYTLPDGFPFAACPGGSLIESSSSPNVSQIVEYKTSQSAREISEFYTQDIKSKGWALTSGGMQTPFYSVLRATKGKAKVIMHINSGERSPSRVRIVLLLNPE